MKNNSKKYLLEVTEEQLRLIAECVEDCHRFASGQCELSNTVSRLENCVYINDALKEIKPSVTPLLPHLASYAWNGGDCPDEYQRKFIAKTYPIYREIYHFLAVSKGISNTYTSETLTCAEGGDVIKINEK